MYDFSVFCTFATPRSSPTSPERSQCCPTEDTHFCFSSPVIKAAENVPSSPWSQPGLGECSAPQYQSSRTPGSRLISSAFCFRGCNCKGTHADCHKSPQCSLRSGSPLRVIQGIYTHTRACLTVTIYLCVNIYEIFSFLEKEKVHSAGP